MLHLFSGQEESLSVAFKMWFATASIGVMSAAHALLAQVPPAIPGSTSELIPNITNFGAVSVLAWLSWHITTKGQPALLKDEREERGKLISLFLESTKTMMEAHTKEFREIMDQLHRDRNEKAAAIKDLSEKVEHLAGVVSHRP